MSEPHPPAQEPQPTHPPQRVLDRVITDATRDQEAAVLQLDDFFTVKGNAEYEPYYNWHEINLRLLPKAAQPMVIGMISDREQWTDAPWFCTNLSMALLSVGETSKATLDQQIFHTSSLKYYGVPGFIIGAVGGAAARAIAHRNDDDDN